MVNNSQVQNYMWQPNYVTINGLVYIMPLDSFSPGFEGDTCSTLSIIEQLPNVELLVELRTDVERIKKHIITLRENFSEDANESGARAVAILEKNVSDIEELISGDIESLSDASVSTIKGLMDRMSLILETDEAFSVSVEEIEGEISAMQEVDLDEFISSLTEGEMQELNSFANDLWEEMFPPSYVDSWYQHLMLEEGEDISGNAALALSIPNALEASIMGVIALFDPETWRDAYQGTKTLYNMEAKAYADMWSFMANTYFEELDAARLGEKAFTKKNAAYAISFILSCLLIVGAFSKAKKGIKALKIPNKLKYALPMILGNLKRGKLLKLPKAAPAAAIGAILYKYTDGTFSPEVHHLGCE